MEILMRKIGQFNNFWDLAANWQKDNYKSEILNQLWELIFGLLEFVVKEEALNFLKSHIFEYSVTTGDKEDI